MVYRHNITNNKVNNPTSNNTRNINHNKNNSHNIVFVPMQFGEQEAGFWLNEKKTVLLSG
jgi:hypothetical protein